MEQLLLKFSVSNDKVAVSNVLQVSKSVKKLKLTCNTATSRRSTGAQDTAAVV